MTFAGMRHGLKILLLSVSGLGIVSLVMSFAGSVHFRYPANYAEAVVLLPILNMAKTPWVYGDMLQMPHHLMPYHPLYLYLSYGVSWLTGPGYASGRTMTFIATLVSAVLISLICRRRMSVDPLTAAIAGSIFLANPFIGEQARQLRPDMTALAFALAGLYWGTGKGSGKAIISACFFALALMTKQNFFLAAGTTWILLISHKRYRDAAIFTVVLLVLTTSGMTALYFGSGGHYWDHIRMAANPFYSWKIFLINWNEVRSMAAVPLAAGLLASALLTVCGRSSDRIAAVYFAVTAPFLLYMGKSGAGTNHTIEPLAATCIALGTFWGSDLGRRVRPIQFITALTLMFNLILFPIRWDPRPIRAALSETEARMDELIPILRSTSKPILAENPGILTAAGLPVWYQAYEFAQMSYAGYFDQSIVLNELKRKDYGMVVVETNFMRAKGTGRFTPEFIKTLSENYRLAGVKHGQFIYVPK